jgi:hypothetical protein
MQIFYLHEDPQRIAQMYHDIHVVKMIGRYATILGTVHRVLDGKIWVGATQTGRVIKAHYLEDAEMNYRLPKAMWAGHPSIVWACSSLENYNWLYTLWTSLCNEYFVRFKQNCIPYVQYNTFLQEEPYHIDIEQAWIDPSEALLFTEAFSKYWDENDPIGSNRKFYYEDKKANAVWSVRDTPKWWKKLAEQERIALKTQGQEKNTNKEK